MTGQFPLLREAIDSGAVRVSKEKSVGGARRRKKLDLLFYRKGESVPAIAIEAKTCMTAHAKAISRLLAELNSSIDALLEENPDGKFFAMIAVNFGLRFTSPLNLPGPNIHGASDGPEFVESLNSFIQGNSQVSGALILPIDFDNERVCKAALACTHADSLDAQVRFERGILSALGL